LFRPLPGTTHIVAIVPSLGTAIAWCLAANMARQGPLQTRVSNFTDDCGVPYRSSLNTQSALNALEVVGEVHPAIASSLQR
jgi:hypothetical protein